ncbi:MAG: hypothetical protein IJ647_09380 [Prevotella sp.]|nr:hypothetical protein [Prevotella sp.]
MKIETFTEMDIKEASKLAYPVWGEGHAANGQGECFGLLMCEYIIRYGWYGEPFAFKITEDGKMLGCILAGNIKQDNHYNQWLEEQLPTFNEKQKHEALALKDYFGKTSPKVYRHMTAAKDLYLSFFLSSVPGCGKLLLAEIVSLAREKGYESLYLWTDASCNHGYYDHHGFEKVAEFKGDEWATDSADYLTYIYRKTI